MEVLVVLLIVLIISTEKVIPFSFLFGRPAEREDFPWQAAIRPPGGNYLASGALISNRHVVTSCSWILLFRLQEFEIQFGSVKSKPPYEKGKLVVTTDTVIMHPQCTANKVTNDLALIELKKPIKRSGYINSILLDGKLIHEKFSLTLSGWNEYPRAYYNDYLKFFNLTTISLSMCSKHYKEIDSTVLCCAPSAPFVETECDITYGSPLVRVDDKNNYVLVGVLSRRPINCYRDYPTTYTRIRQFVRWLLYQMHFSY